MKIEIEVPDTIRRLVHPHAILAAMAHDFEHMAHDFEHQVALLYGEGLDDPEDGENPVTSSPAPASPAAKDAAKYAH